LKILFVTPYPIEGPSSRYRVWQYLPYLEKAGLHCRVSSLLNSQAFSIFYKKGHLLSKILILIKGFFKRLFLLPIVSTYDVVFIQKEAFPFGLPFFEKLIKLFNKNVIFDFDDAIYLPQTSEGNRIFQFLKSPNKARKVILSSKLTFAGNRILADYAKQFNANVEIVPTTINTDFYVPKENSKIEGPVVIGWIGSQTTAPYLLEVEEPLNSIKERFSDKVKIVIIGGGTFRFQKLEAEYKPWKMKDELVELQNFDIGIMPLPDDDWTRGKCGFKALLYMSVGIPAVCSAVGVNREIISHEKNGFLIERETDWESVYARLIEDDELRKRTGKLARERIVDHYSLELWADKLIQLIKNI
jgi:glycosyltransferase involved in cell wall biosynthesis